MARAGTGTTGPYGFRGGPAQSGHGDGTGNPFVTDEDLCVVLGNLLDNAIAENQHAPPGAERYIQLYIAPEEGALVIRLKNPLFRPLSVRGGLPATLKPDAVHHGIGLKNVRRICDRYNGELVWNDENRVFEITARLIITV
jgi:sensor histidine kinase regulating citrate/malate metabolism